MSDVYEMHEAECSGAYRNSVREVMGVSGIIPDEYWDGLDKLRERLGLSEETAQQLFSVEVTVKMKEFGTKAVDAMTAKMESQQQPDKTDDKGSINIEAPALSTEVLNLVDFVRRATLPTHHLAAAPHAAPPCSRSPRGGCRGRRVRLRALRRRSPPR
jgi:hypothetical protein